MMINLTMFRCFDDRHKCRSLVLYRMFRREKLLYNMLYIWKVVMSEVGEVVSVLNQSSWTRLFVTG